MSKLDSVSILGGVTVESFRALLSLGNSADPFSKPETVFIGLYSGSWVSTFKLRWFNEFLRSVAKSVGVNVTVGIRTIAEVLRNFTSSFVQVRVFDRRLFEIVIKTTYFSYVWGFSNFNFEISSNSVVSILQQEVENKYNFNNVKVISIDPFVIPLWVHELCTYIICI